MLEKLEFIFFKSHFQRLALILLGVLFFIPFIGNVHLFDWDEINFAEISREMMTTGNYFVSQIDFKPFYEKPPLFNWLQILLFKTFGISDFSARLINALFGILSLLLMFNIGKKHRTIEFGMVWALCYLSSLFPHFYFKTGVIDPVFNFFIFLSVIYLFEAVENNSKKKFFISGIINGVAVLVKGPVALLLLAITWATTIVFKKTKITKQLIIYGLIFAIGVLLVVSVWLLPLIFEGGSLFLKEFTSYMLSLLNQGVATHGQPFYYHFVVIFFGCFPISIIALKNLTKNQKSSPHKLSHWMFALFWVVLIIFSLVKTKIVHYSSMTYFPLAYLAADALLKRKFPKKLMMIIGVITSAIFFALPILLTQKSWILNLAKNDQVAIDIIKDLNIPSFVSIFSLFLILAIILFHFYTKKQEIRKAILSFSLLFSLFFSSFLFVVLPPIENAVQGGAISFYKEFANKDVYLTTLGFHSYGRLYYFQKTFEQSQYSNEDLLLKTLNKPVYFVTKSSFNDQNILKYNQIKFVEQRGAYKLYVRIPENK